ncbi:TniQ family protein [Mycobacterium intracellulare subsp. chimaera]|nr:TniQ family protein [Mycobacterium intracellulare subsp. chimaera]MCA2354359.1 TniQ family protein [Mycobacterium intracellulare subsp. chimaera]
MSARTLPIRLAPTAGEALDSYLEMLASRSHTAWSDMLDAAGLAHSATRSGAGIHSWLVRLTAAQRDALSQATGVSVSRLESMTLAGLCAVLAGAPSSSTPLAPALRSPARSRYCPHCLRDSGGSWQLWWRLIWAFGCPRHHCLLADYCPACGRWERVGLTPTSRVPAPGYCSATLTSDGHSLSVCGADLTTSHVPRFTRGHSLITAQQRLLDCLSHGTVSGGIYGCQQHAATQFFADMAAVAGRILRYARPEDIRGRIPADLHGLHQQFAERGGGKVLTRLAHSMTAASTAIAAVAALDILDSPDIAIAGARLRWLVTPAPSRWMDVDASQFGRGKKVGDALRGVQLSALEPYLGLTDQLRYRCGSPLPRIPQATTTRHRQVPAMLWPSVMLRFAVSQNDTELAEALAVAVLVVGTRITLAQAASVLGSAITAASVSRVLQILSTDSCWPGIRLSLIRIADILDANGCPIDYQARRESPFEVFLDDREWNEIRSRLTAESGISVPRWMVQCWMYERVSGSPARQCGAAINTPNFGAKLADFNNLVRPDLVARLDQLAQNFLRRHGYGHHPLRWQPDIELCFDGAPPLLVQPQAHGRQLP